MAFELSLRLICGSPKCELVLKFHGVGIWYDLRIFEKCQDTGSALDGTVCSMPCLFWTDHAQLQRSRGAVEVRQNEV